MNKTRVTSTLVLILGIATGVSCGSSDNGAAPNQSVGGSGPTGGSSASTSAGGATTSTSSTASRGGSTDTASSASGGSTATSSSQATAGGAAGQSSSITFGFAGAAANPFACPSSKPVGGDACSRQAALGACTYDDGGCTCTNQKWSCYANSDCPSAAPASQASCTLNAMRCSYGDLSCTCSTDTGWSCETACPASKPAGSASCTRAAASTCRYGDDSQLVTTFGTAPTTCACSGGSYTCFTSSDCPTDAPTNSSACKMTTLSCNYTDRNCNCDADGTWKCTTNCPSATPAASSSCSRPANQACQYAAGALVQGASTTSDATCVCENEKFTCYTSSDCPTAAPESDVACTQLGLNCPYNNNATSCRCRTSTSKWSCSNSPGLGGGGASGLGGASGRAGSSGRTGGPSAGMAGFAGRMR